VFFANINLYLNSIFSFKKVVVGTTYFDFDAKKEPCVLNQKRVFKFF